MSTPNALIAVRDTEAKFRLESMPRHHFHSYLCRFRRQFPTMTWDGQLRMWRLSIIQLKPLYELCRELFGPEQIRILHLDFITRTRSYQPSLFE